jgi:hypothetical protein
MEATTQMLSKNECINRRFETKNQNNRFKLHFYLKFTIWIVTKYYLKKFKNKSSNIAQWP